jgi:hypothetical protein
MKKKALPTPAPAPTDDQIRDYAYHLYCQKGCQPGRDLENWLEAKACLSANPPIGRDPARPPGALHRPKLAA